MTTPTAPDTHTIVDLPLDAVYAIEQDRKQFSEAGLHELAESIRQHGLAQPITVRPDGDGRHVIIAGERRFRAHQMLEAPTIRAIIADLDDEKAADVQLIENVSRADLDPFEEGAAYRARMDRFGLDEEGVAARYGKPVGLVRSRLALLGLKPEYQQLVRAGDLTVSHATSLARLDDNRQALAVAAFRKANGMTVWQFTTLCDRLYDEQQADSMFDPDAFLQVEDYVEKAKSASSVTGRDLVHLCVDLAALIAPHAEALEAVGVDGDELSRLLQKAEQVRLTRVEGKNKATASGSRGRRKAPKVR